MLLLHSTVISTTYENKCDAYENMLRVTCQQLAINQRLDLQSIISLLATEWSHRNGCYFPSHNRHEQTLIAFLEVTLLCMCMLSFAGSLCWGLGCSV